MAYLCPSRLTGATAAMDHGSAADSVQLGLGSGCQPLECDNPAPHRRIGLGRNLRYPWWRACLTHRREPSATPKSLAAYTV